MGRSDNGPSLTQAHGGGKDLCLSLMIPRNAEAHSHVLWFMHKYCTSVTSQSGRQYDGGTESIISDRQVHLFASIADLGCYNLRSTWSWFWFEGKGGIGMTNEKSKIQRIHTELPPRYLTWLSMSILLNPSQSFSILLNPPQSSWGPSSLIPQERQTPSAKAPRLQRNKVKVKKKKKIQSTSIILSRGL